MNGDRMPPRTAHSGAVVPLCVGCDGESRGCRVGRTSECKSHTGKASPQCGTFCGCVSSGVEQMA